MNEPSPRISTTMRSAIASFLLALVGFILPAASAWSAEITVLTTRNKTEGRWDSVDVLHTSYVDTNGFIFPTIHSNGVNVYRSSVTGSSTTTSFDSRFIGVSGTEEGPLFRRISRADWSVSRPVWHLPKPVVLDCDESRASMSEGP